MPTNHDENLQDRYAREFAAMEPKTPMVHVMAQNWQDESLPPTWQQIQQARAEHNALASRVADMEAALTHIHGVALADDPRDLPGIAIEAAKALGIKS